MSEVTRLFLTRTKAHVFLCAGPSCGRRGSRALLERGCRAMDERRRRLAGGHVQLTASGCQGACNYGPNAVAHFAAGGGLREARRRGLDEARLLALLDALDAGGPLPDE